MADFVWKKKSVEPFSRFERIYTRKIKLDENLVLFGEENTFFHIQREDEFIVVLGYCHYPGETIQTTLLKILDTFKESVISQLKIQLIGHYILLIKKGGSLYIFADFLHVRNLFYARDFSIISSSFSVVEQFLGANFHDLNMNKVVEYLIMIYNAYPSWLGNGTTHLKIQFLKPYEYIVADAFNNKARKGNVIFSIDNNKEFNIHKISTQLISALKDIINDMSFKKEKIGVTLTGGYDTRLIASLVIESYDNVTFRIATSELYPNSYNDSKIAQKIANSLTVPIKIYNIVNDNTIDDFYFISEGMSPLENSVIQPIIKRTNEYSLGFGGCFGTELFMRMDWSSSDEYIEAAIIKAKKHIQGYEEQWDYIRSAMMEEFRNIRHHYQLTKPNATDEARIFLLLSAAFFSSFMLSPYNIRGLELEPYGHFALLELALKVPKELMGLSGTKIQNILGKAGRFQTNLVQKMAMSKINRRIGKIITTHYQPMLPYSVQSFPYYLIGFIKLKSLQSNIKKLNVTIQQKKVVINNDLCHITNGWDKLFLRRIKEIYNIDVETQG